MTALAGALTIAGLGCGGHHDPLEGDWVYQDMGGCTTEYLFDNGAVTLNYYCQLQGGGVGLEQHAGTYVISGNSVTLTKTSSSCPGEKPAPITVGFAVGGGTLMLTYPDQVEQLSAGNPPLTGTAQFGCYDDMGTFTPSPVTPL